MAEKKKNNMSREEAAELYRDLKRTMATMKKSEPSPAQSASNKSVAKEIAQAIKKAMAKDDMESAKAKRASKAAPTPAPEPEDPWNDTGIEAQLRSMSSSRFSRTGKKGEFAALMLVLSFACFRGVMSGMEAVGIAKVELAEASFVSAPRAIAPPGPTFSKEEMSVLTELDARRQELEARGRGLEEKELEADRRDKEFAVKLTELRELTNKLKSTREQLDRKQTGQLDQLANVYGSMNPNEAAALMEQLDVTIALSLLERMPEKRIGQILALMTPERALQITKMLSSGVKQAG